MYRMICLYRHIRFLEKLALLDLQLSSRLDAHCVYISSQLFVYRLLLHGPCMDYYNIGKLLLILTSKFTRQLQAEVLQGYLMTCMFCMQYIKSLYDGSYYVIMHRLNLYNYTSQSLIILLHVRIFWLYRFGLTALAELSSCHCMSLTMQMHALCQSATELLTLHAL